VTPEQPVTETEEQSAIEAGERPPTEAEERPATETTEQPVTEELPVLMTANQSAVRSTRLRQRGPFLLGVALVVVAAAAAAILLATGTFGHGSAPSSVSNAGKALTGKAPAGGDRYCPSVLNALPAAAPVSAKDATSDVAAINAVMPPASDTQLSRRIVKLDNAIEKIGREYAKLKVPSAGKIAKFDRAVSRLRAYCH
jgi:hypothetical protein